MTPLYDKIVNCQALIVGGVSYFEHPNGFTRIFLERMFPLRHRMPQTMGKPVSAVVVGCSEGEKTVREIFHHLESYFYCNFVGSAFFNSKTPPCFICSFGTTCLYGGPARRMTPEEFERFTEITPDIFQNFEDHPDIVAACERLSNDLRTTIETDGKQ